MYQLKDKKVLFLSPAFFKYETKIMKKMEEMGAKVDYYDERSVTNSFHKALLKISPKIFYKKTIRYYDNILDSNKNKDYDFILIIKCDMIPKIILKKIKYMYPNSKLILYLWDSIDNIPDIESKFEYFDSIKSFDMKDCDNNKQIEFRPLFYADEYKKSLRLDNAYKYDVSFVGTIHSDRFKIIKELEKIAEDNNLNTYWFKYLQSRFIYYFYKIIKKEFLKTKITDFDFSKKSSKEISNIINESRCVVDIQHPKQTGLTMRTIEMIGMQKKIITTNKEIEKYDFYDKNNIQIIDRKNIKLDLMFFNTNYKPLNEIIYNKYSLDYWILDVLGINGIGE